MIIILKIAVTFILVWWIANIIDISLSYLGE